MITTIKLIAVLFHVITIVTSNPNIPADVKTDVVNQIIQAVADENQATTTEAVQASSSETNSFMAQPVPAGNSVPSQLPAAASTADQVTPGSISIAGQPNSDGSYSVMARLNDASSMLVEVVNVAHNDDFKANTSSDNEIFTLYDKGDWTYTVTSYDRNGGVMSVSNGSFTIN